MAQQFLDDTERQLVQKIANNPLELLAGDLRGHLEDFIRVTVGTGGARSQYVPGDLKTVITDLTAETGVYVFSDDSGDWLYCNGAAANRTTYADLFTLCGTSFGAGDGSTTFNLPDARGRALWFTGTSSTTDLGDNDGIGLSLRVPSVAVSVSGTTGSESSHTHGAGSYSVSVSATGTQYFVTSGASPAAPGSYSVAGTSGAGSAHSHSFSGSGSGAVPNLVIGSLLVRFS